MHTIQSIVVLSTLALVPLLPRADVERYDALIHNPVYCGRDGRLVLDQYGWLDLIEVDGSADYHWQGWVLTNRCLHPVRQGESWQLSYRDGGRRRVIRAPVFFQNSSTYDLEIADRAVWPETKRRTR